ncbi:hypothetical protein [Caproicibacter sp.]
MSSISIVLNRRGEIAAKSLSCLRETARPRDGTGHGGAGDLWGRRS